MLLPEFYEFLGRVAFLVFPAPGMTFVSKVYRVFASLFRKIGVSDARKAFNEVTEFCSDYEDDFAEDYLSSKHSGEVYAGFGNRCHVEGDQYLRQNFADLYHKK